MVGDAVFVGCREKGQRHGDHNAEQHGKRHDGEADANTCHHEVPR
jgi:hypothetical protein